MKTFIKELLTTALFAIAIGLVVSHGAVKHMDRVYEQRWMQRCTTVHEDKVEKCMKAYDYIFRQDQETY